MTLLREIVIVMYVVVVSRWSLFASHIFVLVGSVIKRHHMKFNRVSAHDEKAPYLKVIGARGMSVLNAWTHG